MIFTSMNLIIHIIYVRLKITRIIIFFFIPFSILAPDFLIETINGLILIANDRASVICPKLSGSADWTQTKASHLFDEFLKEKEIHFSTLHFGN